MTSVDACDPELPPLEMMSGTNSARTTAFAISFSKNPIAVAVSISPMNRTTSQPARFLTIRDSEICRYGSSNASDPPNSWNSRVATASATSRASSTVTMPMSTPAVSSHRQGAPVFAAEHLDGGGLRVGGLESHILPVHQVRNAIGQRHDQELADPNVVDQHAVVVDDINHVQCFAVLAVFPNEIEYLLHGPVFLDRNVVRRHQPTNGPWLVAEQRDRFGALLVASAAQAAAW